MITYAYWDWIESVLVKGDTGVKHTVWLHAFPIAMREIAWRGDWKKMKFSMYRSVNEAWVRQF